MEKVTPHPWLKLTVASQLLLTEDLQYHFSFTESVRVRSSKWKGDSPSLRSVRTLGGDCAPRASVQCGLVIRVQVNACTRGGTCVSNLEGETSLGEMGGHLPSMMSISPPAGHGPAWLRVQKAGQVAQPAGIWARSRTNIPSSYAFCEEMRMLSRPRALGLTMDQSSARMMNLYPSGAENSLNHNLSDEWRKSDLGIRRTVGQIFAYRIALAHVVDAAVGWVILSFPVPALEKVVAAPLVLKNEDVRCSALREGE